MNYSSIDDLEHPDITAIRKTGYPLRYQPVEYYCDECGTVIDDEIYEDEDHKSLCLDCLLALHKKELFA